MRSIKFDQIAQRPITAPEAPGAIAAGSGSWHSNAIDAEARPEVAGKPMPSTANSIVPAAPATPVSPTR
jgi:hypothetical protein